MNYTDNYSRISSAGEEILTIHRTGDDAIVIRYLDAVEISETRMTVAEAQAELDRFIYAGRGGSLVRKVAR